MSGLKLYIHWEVSGFPEKTSKIQIPKSWLLKPVKEVIGLFATPYNNHNKDTLIDVEDVHFETAEGVKIYSNDIVGEVLEDKFDYHLKLGAHVKKEVAQAAAGNDAGSLRCRNYGCNKFFKEEENEEGCCQHHTGPPIFHDTMKCWSCCRERKAFDFESFQLICGCSTGKHSTVPPSVAIAASPNAPSSSSSSAAADGSAPAPAPVLQSIADFNKTNPEAASAAASAARIVTAERKSSRSADGLTAKCQRKGCQKTFLVGENSASSCTYHAGTLWWLACDIIRVLCFFFYHLLRGGVVCTLSFFTIHYDQFLFHSFCCSSWSVTGFLLCVFSLLLYPCSFPLPLPFT
jgi:hypothetical protein